MADNEEINELLEMFSKKHFFFRKNHYHQLIEEESSYFQFNPAPYRLSKPKGIYVNGYWQNPQYFPKSFRNEVNFLNLCPGKFDRILNEIKNKESVAVHVRRGDFVDDKKVSEVHGTCSQQYYFEAINLLESELENPTYFIFSDDIEWCRKNLNYQNFNYVSSHDEGEWLDFVLMMSCRNQIISNSTFSWWAAWLNNNKYKKVVAPLRWFRNNQWDTDDLIPKTWIRLNDDNR